MFSSRDLPDTLPLFPLPGAILLPRGRLPLQIFEPRYLALLDDALKTSHRLIGMIQPQESHGAEAPEMHAIGCAGRVTSFTETDDGRYMVTLTGVSRFRVKGQVSGFTPYIRAEVDWAGFGRDRGGVEHDPNFDRAAFLALLRRYFRAEGMEADWDSLKEADEELLINSLSMLSPFDAEDKQALLEAPTLKERSETLVTLMDFAMRGGNDDEVMQ